ncbi:helix-turn-helix transcriptional regulator [Streptomyces sp. NBC_00091]|uniref:helix-turn-helix transcriptional regulator n=1 Tax=Streptomyces sp. NBC_00091 TaxID=2975648 RepID=UPI002254C67F|nr:helix-turn-helix transcriptional regulator [Streptomyces sp. NBC_00091]MCX5381118.1 helix-turn-helix transcriptional regulator [Streptomyces sp. NBC_00091]
MDVVKYVKTAQSGTPEELCAAAAGEPQAFLRELATHLGLLAQEAAQQAARPATAPALEACGEEVVGPGVRYLHGLGSISTAINDALGSVRRDILTAQPDGARPSAVLKDALESVRRHISAGIAMRTLYQHTTRFDEATKEYVRAVTEYGAQVRTLEEFFDRLIIVDDVAFISANEDRTTAISITEPTIVRFLRDTFDKAWDRAKPFPFVPLHAAKAADEVVPAIRESISRLLVEGYSDKAIARRIGISERSLQAHIAAIKQDLGALNRLQLGYLLGRNEATYVL